MNIHCQSSRDAATSASSANAAPVAVRRWIPAALKRSLMRDSLPDARGGSNDNKWRKPKEAPPDGAALVVALDLAEHGKVFIVFRWRDLLQVSGLRFAVKQLEAEIEFGENVEAEDFRPAALLRRLRRAGCGGLQLHGRVLRVRRELQDLGRSFLGLFKGECGRSPDRQGSNYASRKRTIPHGLLSAYKMIACSLDFKPVAKPVKGVLRQENSRRSTNVCGTVATALRPTFAEPRARTRKKRPPRRAVLTPEDRRSVRSRCGRPNRSGRSRRSTLARSSAFRSERPKDRALPGSCRRRSADRQDRDAWQRIRSRSGWNCIDCSRNRRSVRRHRPRTSWPG